VTKEGWKVFRENLNKALAILNQAENRPVKNPEFYLTLLTVGRGLDKSADWIQNAFDQGLAVKSDYQDLYKEIAEYLLPRWHGSPQEVVAFANAAIQPAREGASHIQYAYIAAWVYARETREDFMKYKLDYHNIKRGCEQLLALYPDSANNANRLCMFACMYKDKDTARKLFPKVEEAFIPEMWKNDRDYCLECKTWAFSEDKPTEPKSDPVTK
jgi:hypothetical protein